MPDSVSSQRENHQQPNKTVLTPHSGHDIPAAINSPGSRQGHGLCMGLKAQEQQVLTCRRPPSTESAGWADPLTLIRRNPVERLCFLGRVRPDRLAEYRERHAAVWPEI